MASKTDQVDSISDGSVLHGEVMTGDQAVYAGCGGAMGVREVWNASPLARVLSAVGANGAYSVNGERGMRKSAYHEAILHLLCQCSPCNPLLVSTLMI